MTRIILITVFLMSLTQLFAQTQPDSIEVKKGFWGVTFKQDGKILTTRQLLDLTQSNTEAFKEMNIAKNNFTAGSVFGFAGGFMVGYPLGASVGGGKPNWVMAGIGACLICVSIPFSTAYSKHARNAVRIYNSGKPLSMNKIDLKLNLTYNGIGVKINF